jgi:hypothetical protein
MKEKITIIPSDILTHNFSEDPSVIRKKCMHYNDKNTSLPGVIIVVQTIHYKPGDAISLSAQAKDLYDDLKQSGSVVIVTDISIGTKTLLDIVEKQCTDNKKIQAAKKVTERNNAKIAERSA